MKKISLSFAGVSVSVWNAVGLHVPDHCWRKATGNGNSVDALLETIDSLPLADPAVIRLCGSDHPVEVGGGAVVDVVPMVAQVQERLAVVTTIALKLIKRLHE